MKADPKQIDQLLNDAGYKFLGWQNGWASIMLDKDGNQTDDYNQYVKFGGYPEDKYPEYNACKKQCHKLDDIGHNNRGTENTVSCDICKIYYKYDCGD